MNDPPPAKRTRRLDSPSTATALQWPILRSSRRGQRDTHADPLPRGPRTHDMFSFRSPLRGGSSASTSSCSASSAARGLAISGVASISTRRRRLGATRRQARWQRSQQLAGEQIAVLDCSTLTRNFILVRYEHVERALQCLQDVIKEAAGRKAQTVVACALAAASSPGRLRAAAKAAVRLALLPGEVIRWALARWRRTMGSNPRLSNGPCLLPARPATRTVAQTGRLRTRCCNCRFSRPPERRHRPSSTTSRWAARSR